MTGWWSWWWSADARVRARRGAVLLALGSVAGCALHPQLPPQPGKPQIGVASWYGPGFHGERTSSGEVYDQNELTAAHPTLPLGTVVRVTNLDSGRSVDVRVNDRGPFVKDRAIDLSHAAAHQIGMLGPGTAPVRIDVLERPPGGFERVAYCVQVGSFRDEEKARALRADLVDRNERVYISSVLTRADRVYRVRVGPYLARADAERRAGELQRSGLAGIVAEEPQP